jgi:hypothetical protein
MWRADASITAGVYNTQPKSAARTVSAELWDSTGLSRDIGANQFRIRRRDVPAEAGHAARGQLLVDDGGLPQHRVLQSPRLAQIGQHAPRDRGDP